MWLGLAPLHPHPSPKSAPESFLTGGSGGTVPSTPLTQGDRGWAVSTTRTIPPALFLGLCHGCQFPSPSAAPRGHPALPAALAQPCLRSLQRRLQGCLRQCAALSVPHSPLLWAAFPPQLLPLPSALPSFGIGGARVCGHFAPLLMLEGPQGRLRGSWPSRESGTRAENAFPGLA